MTLQVLQLLPVFKNIMLIIYLNESNFVFLIDSDGNTLSCPCSSTDLSCFSVQMPQDENIMKMSCMQFTRSSPTFPNISCTTGYREQLNLITSFIDGSAIYGTSVEQCNQLRLFSGGDLLFCLLIIMTFFILRIYIITLP
jgi:hypothetical protein